MGTKKKLLEDLRVKRERVSSSIIGAAAFTAGVARETCRNPTWADLIHSKLQSNSHSKISHTEQLFEAWKKLVQQQQNFSIVQNFPLRSKPMITEARNFILLHIFFNSRISFIHKTMMRSVWKQALILIYTISKSAQANHSV